MLPACPLAVFHAGAGPDVPIVLGTNLHEGIGYLDEATLALTWEGLQRLFQDAFGESSGALTEAYGPSRYDSATAAWVVFVGDWIYHCPDRRVLQALEGRAAPTYRYLFGGVLSDPRHVERLANHGTDVPFVFRNFGTLATTPSELALSNAMATRWTSFAATGAPTADGSWRAWDDAGRGLLVLGLDEIGMVEGFRDAECDLLDRVPPLRDMPSEVLPFPARLGPR